MSLKTLIFFFGFLYLAGGSLFNPVLGVLGYMFHYMLGVEKQWWHAPLNPLGIRYSFTFAILIAAGIFINRSKLRFGNLIKQQELLGILFVLLIWFLYIVNPETSSRYLTTDPPTIKLTKVLIFCLMMTHVITKNEYMDRVLWVLVIGSFLLGLQAYDLPRSAFTAGRLDGRVGGSDFVEANGLATFMVACTIIIAVKFMESSWKGKIICGLSGAFALNTIILCQSRGALLALIGGVMAIAIASPIKFKKHIVWGGIVALIGMIYLTDTSYLERMMSITEHADSILESREASDRSAMMRIEVWTGGLQMFQDHPFGVGAGNFNNYIGSYSPSVSGMSPHSLYIQVLADLGILGLILLFALLWTSLRMLLKIIKYSQFLPESDQKKYQWKALGLGGVIVAYMTNGLTGHVLYSEGFWWFLMFPVCLQRAFENTVKELPSSD